MNYLQFVARLDSMTTLDQSQLPIMIPSIIDYAEQRIYRDLDLLTTVTRDKSATLTPYVRELILPTATAVFVTVQTVKVFVPLSPGDLLNSQGIALSAVSRDLLDCVYPSPVPSDRPKWFAMLDDKTILVGPWPDQGYPIEITGTTRPKPLYALGASESTFLSLNLPDLFMAAAMIFVSRYQKSDGSQADNPNSAMSWEAQYATLLASADKEEARRKFQSAGWTSLSAATAASPTR